jgi:hypothetical protein
VKFRGGAEILVDIKGPCYEVERQSRSGCCGAKGERRLRGIGRGAALEFRRTGGGGRGVGEERRFGSGSEEPSSPWTRESSEGMHVSGRIVIFFNLEPNTSSGGNLL